MVEPGGADEGSFFPMVVPLAIGEALSTLQSIAPVQVNPLR